MFVKISCCGGKRPAKPVRGAGTAKPAAETAKPAAGTAKLAAGSGTAKPVAGTAKPIGGSGIAKPANGTGAAKPVRETGTAKPVGGTGDAKPADAEIRGICQQVRLYIYILLAFQYILKSYESNLSDKRDSTQIWRNGYFYIYIELIT